MQVVQTVGELQEDGTLEVRIRLLPGQPAGRRRVVIVVDDAPLTNPAPLDLPVHDVGPWPEGLSLRREDMYGDDGR